MWCTRWRKRSTRSPPERSAHARRDPSPPRGVSRPGRRDRYVRALRHLRTCRAAHDAIRRVAGRQLHRPEQSARLGRLRDLRAVPLRARMGSPAGLRPHRGRDREEGREARRAPGRWRGHTRRADGHAAPLHAPVGLARIRLREQGRQARYPGLAPRAEGGCLVRERRGLWPEAHAAVDADESDRQHPRRRALRGPRRRSRRLAARGRPDGSTDGRRDQGRVRERRVPPRVVGAERRGPALVRGAVARGARLRLVGARPVAGSARRGRAREEDE